MKEKHYYSTMSREERAAYVALSAGFLRLERSIRIPKLPPEALGRIFFQLRLDDPMIFYVSSFSYRFALDASHVELLPVYSLEKPKILEHRRAIEARVARLIRPVQGKSEAEKEQFIHDFICRNVRYDKLEKPYSHEVIGPLLLGVSVCEGIAKTVKLLCEALGMECIVAICDNDRANGVKYRHAWNILKVNGQWYHMDATFDNSLSRCGTIRYDYYNLDDKRFFRDHRPLQYPAPACTDSGHFYYKESKQSWTKPEEVASRAAQAIRKKKTYFLFHWRGGYLNRRTALELAELIRAAAAAKGKGVRISINAPQSVFFAAFLDEEPGDALALEQPDEGENALEPAALPEETGAE